MMHWKKIHKKATLKRYINEIKKSDANRIKKLQIE